MVMTKGKAIFVCPKTGKEVNLATDCMNPNKKGASCPYFKFWSWESAHPVIVCDVERKTSEEATKPGL